jgi:hypothetical protein
VPLAALHPYIAGSLIIAYFSDGRFHPDPHASVFNPMLSTEPEPAVRDLSSDADLRPTGALREPSSAVREGSTDNQPPP